MTIPPEVNVIVEPPPTIVVEVSEVGLVGAPGPVGPQGPPGMSGDASLIDHVDSPTPHPVYDDGPSLALLYENAKV